MHRVAFRGWLVVLVAGVVFAGCATSPPSLMDDVDAVQAQIARNMLESGDWVTARLDGIKYLEKAPLFYWLIAIAFKIAGVADWAARIPVVLSAILLCWLTARIGRWAFSEQAGEWAGLSLATSVGMFLFTRILIPDVCVTLAVTLGLWAFLRLVDEREQRPRLWATVFAGSIGVGLLLKGFIAAVFPAGIVMVYLLGSGDWRKRQVWDSLRIPSGLLIVLVIAAPWHILATIRNPPWFAFTLHSGPGEYKGFAWFYFVNEHLLRFLNLRYPRDYNTVPRLWFWLLHLVWLFPWTVCLPAVFGLRFRPTDRAGRTRFLALCWIGFVLVFFTFSTTQEYYSMPAYPAMALLLGEAASSNSAWNRWGLRFGSLVSLLACLVTGWILFEVHNLQAPGDISRALTQHPSAYTLSLGHMGDLTMASFAYLRWPLGMASLAFAVGSAGTFVWQGRKAYVSLTVMMVLLLHAARFAMIAFNPYLSSRPLASALLAAPPGELILDDQYYTFSSVIFYTNRPALLLNGRVNNLEYGSNATGAPQVFIDDVQLGRLWRGSRRWYLLADATAAPRLEKAVGPGRLYLVAESGGKLLFTNQAHT